MAAKKHILLTLFLLLFYHCLKAQQNNHNIQGRIADSLSGENLSNATIMLLSLPDSVIIARSVSNKNGFVLRARPGKYRLHVSHIGYRESVLPIFIREADSILNIGTVLMSNSSRELVQVVVKSSIPPVIVKSDTISYNTSAFKTRPNATVEELLKKLPGIEVDKDGNVTVQGERVQKIFIERPEVCQQKSTS